MTPNYHNYIGKILYYTNKSQYSVRSFLNYTVKITILIVY